MKTLNINDLLADLEKTAGIEKTAGVTKPNVSAELSSILEKKASEDLTGAALAAGEALAKELLTKMAAENEIQKNDNKIIAFDNQKIVPMEGAPGTNTKPALGIDAAIEGIVEEGLKRGAKTDDLVDEIMDGGIKKEAQTKLENTEMAKNIMQKIAEMVEDTTATPNLIQANNAEMTAFDDAKVEPLPGSEGTINNILESIVDRAKEQGAVSDDLVNGDMPATDEEDAIEKAAAVSALVDAGCDFESAVAMVKEAEELLLNDADQLEKLAAINELCAAGYDFDTATDLVKAAAEKYEGDKVSVERVAKTYGKMMGRSFAEAIPGALGGATIGAGLGALTSLGLHTNIKRVAGTGTSLGAVIGSQVGGYHGGGRSLQNSLQIEREREREHEKKSAVDALVDAGIDFDQAMALVKQAEIDVYGEE
jgi:hypothetical protein